MNWLSIDTDNTLLEISALSAEERVLILKYSPACSISIITRLLLEREWNDGMMNMKTYLLNVLVHRNLSDKIEAQYKIKHETPQALIIENDKCIAHFNHGKVIFSELKKFANCLVSS